MSKNRVLVEEQFTWYETNLPLLERKKRGHFSTPLLLVEKILDACCYTPDNDLTQVRVLDPACGSGNFLIEAARRLQAFSVRTGLSSRACALLLQRNLWGIDPDPISCFLAEMHVQTIIHSSASRPTPFTPLHIHQADSLVLPWEPTVDLFIANPPYLAAKNNDVIPSLAFFGCICRRCGCSRYYCPKISSKKRALHFMHTGALALNCLLKCTTSGTTISIQPSAGRRIPLSVKPGTWRCSRTPTNLPRRNSSK